ncbi:MAG TPA: M23 family metallopeptidase [Nocardioides sp.]
MVRAVAGLRVVWARLLVVLFVVMLADIALTLVDDAPVDGLVPGGFVGVVGIIGAIVVCSLLLNVAPRAADRAPIELAPPVRGTWTAINSPGQEVPSHGTRTRGQLCAVDLCARSTPDSPQLTRFGLRGTPPERYPGFDAPIHAMAAGEVVQVLDHQRDHRARDTWQGMAWMMSIEGIVREAGGTRKVLGNHVLVRHDDGVVAAYAHLRRGSAAVRTGQRVAVGDVLGRVGNTGNTSMPHLHVHLMDREHVDAAAGLPITWTGLERTGEIDAPFARWADDPADSAITSMPRNGEVFVVR